MQSLRSLAGPGSVRAYAGRLGERPASAVSVQRLVNADLLHRRYERLGPALLGAPVTDVQRVAGRYTRRYSAGTLLVAAGKAEVEGQVAYRGTLTVAALECIHRAETDQIGGPSSEPYFIATAVDTQTEKGKAVSVLYGPHSDVNGGAWIGYAEPALWEGTNPQNLQVHIALWEQDGGQEHEIRAKVQTAVNDAIHLVSLKFPAVGAIIQSLGSVKDRIVKSLAGIIKEFFKDDFVAQDTLSLTYRDFIENLPPEQVRKGVKYRGVVNLDGGKAGHYKVYLWWTRELVQVPPP